MMRAAILLVLAALARASCGGSDGDEQRGVIQPRGPDPNAISETGTQHLSAVSIRSERQQHLAGFAAIPGAPPTR